MMKNKKITAKTLLSIHDDGQQEPNLTRRTLDRVFNCHGLMAGLSGSIAFPLSSFAAGSVKNNARILIVYYSRTGNTRAVANHIRTATGGTITALEQQIPILPLIGQR